MLWNVHCAKWTVLCVGGAVPTRCSCLVASNPLCQSFGQMFQMVVQASYAVAYYVHLLIACHAFCGQHEASYY